MIDALPRRLPALLVVLLVALTVSRFAGPRVAAASERSGESPDRDARKPNIVLIVADDLGYGDLGCYGCPDIRTPSIDRLAAEGVRLTQFYANGPECSPTRTALLTGRYQHRVGGLECAIGTGNAGRYDDAIRLAARHQLGLPVACNALPSVLESAGYRAAMIGKWHLGYDEKFWPLEHGFDYAFGILGGGADYFHHTEPVGEFLGAELPGTHVLFRNDGPHRRKGYMTHLITSEAVEAIGRQSADRPFFLYVAYTAPHTPLQGPGDYRPEKMTASAWNEGTREKYGELVVELDRGVGAIVAALDRKKLAKNTVVIFSSDNGPTKKGSAGPLSGNKGQLFEGGIRVPCIVWWPGRVPAGSVSNQVAISMDLTASIARIAGAAAPPGRPFDGIDIVKHLEAGADASPRTLFWRARRGDRTEKAVRRGEWKYLHRRLDASTVKEYLFALDRDPAEKENRIERRPDVLAELRKRLEEWEREVRPER